MSPVLPRACEHEVGLSQGSVAFLCVCSEQWAAENQHIQLVVMQQTRHFFFFYKNSISKPLLLTDYLDF